MTQAATMIVTRVIRDMTRGRTERGLLKLLSIGGTSGVAEGGGAIPVVTGKSISAVAVVELVSSMVYSSLWS